MTGSKSELAAMVYTAWHMKIPEEMTAKEKTNLKAAEYS